MDVEIFESKNKEYIKSPADFGYGIYHLKVIDKTDNFILCYKPTSRTTVDMISGVVTSPPEFIIFPKKDINQNVCGIWSKEYNRQTRKQALEEAKQKLRDFETSTTDSKES